MSQNIYEIMFLFDSNRYGKDPNGISAQVNDMIENLGGTVRASRLWNEQRLAYPIKGQRKGTYWLMYCRIDPAKIAEINRACQLNDNILRHMVLKLDPRLEETMVAHALGTKEAADEPEEEAAPPPDSDKASEATEAAAEPEAAAVGKE